jgi:hypothetical protein
MYKELNSTGTLIQRTSREAPQQTYVLRRARRTQEDHQLLREGCKRTNSPARGRWGHAYGVGQMDEDSSSAVDSSNGSDHLHRLDLGLSAAACSAGEGGASGDAAGHCGSQEEK